MHLPLPPTLAEAAASLIPAIRPPTAPPNAWLVALDRAEAALVRAPLAPLLDALVVLDLPELRLFINQGHADRWGATGAQLLAAALDGLPEPEVAPSELADGVLTVHAGALPPSALLATPGFLDRFAERVRGTPIALCPSADRLWVVGSQAGLPLQLAIEAAFRAWNEASTPVSPVPYVAARPATAHPGPRPQPGELDADPSAAQGPARKPATTRLTGPIGTPETQPSSTYSPRTHPALAPLVTPLAPWRPGPDHPLVHKAGVARRFFAGQTYRDQASALAAWILDKQDPTWVAPLSLIRHRGGRVVSFCAWPDGPTLLPPVDLVVLGPPGPDALNQAPAVPWQALVALGVIGAPEPGLIPPRYRVERHPDLSRCRGLAVDPRAYDPDRTPTR